MQAQLGTIVDGGGGFGTQIANEVLAAHERGVKVRVITDDGQSKGLGSDIQKFIDAVQSRCTGLHCGVNGV